MTRVLSALVLLPIVLGVIWFLPPIALLALAEIVLALAVREFVALVRRVDARPSGALTLVTAAAACAATALPDRGADIVLMTGVVTAGVVALGAGRGGRDALIDVGSTLLAAVYVGLPLGALVAVSFSSGRAAVLLLLVVVMASDIMQLYGGKMFGRRPLAPSVSPKKTVEGALIGGLVGVIVMTAGGRWALPDAPTLLLVMLGAAVVAVGIAGDLFESLLKRGAGVKDASGLIPGHGGMLDRLDSLLFAAPLYYAVVRFSGLAGK